METRLVKVTRRQVTLREHKPGWPERVPFRLAPDAPSIPEELHGEYEVPESELFDGFYLQGDPAGWLCKGYRLG